MAPAALASESVVLLPDVSCPLVLLVNIVNDVLPELSVDLFCALLEWSLNGAVRLQTEHDGKSMLHTSKTEPYTLCKALRAR